MNKKIVFTRPDGGLSIVYPTPLEIALRDVPEEIAAPLRAMTEDEYMAFIFEKDVPKDAINARIVGEHFNVPEDRYFRNAWEDVGTSAAVNLGKAREIKVAIIREERNAVLKTLDVELMKANESGDSQKASEIVSQKQKLRDLPVTVVPSLEAISDPEELKTFVPEELKPKK